MITHDEILKMTAGMPIDNLITIVVFGNDKVIKPYSTDICAAWEVLEKLNLEYSITIENINGNVFCRLFIPNTFTYFYAEAETVPLAICKAALLAVLRL